MRKPEPLYKKDDAGKYILDGKGERRVFGWQVRFPKPAGGMNYRRFGTKREAELYSAKLEQQRAGGAVLDVGMRWEEAVKHFRREHYIGLLPSAAHDYDRDLARITPYCTGKRICDISAKLLREWRDAELQRIRTRAITAADAAIEKAERSKDAEKVAELRTRRAKAETKGITTVNGALRSMGTFLKFCKREGYCTTNAALDVKRLKAARQDDAPIDGAIFNPLEITRAVAAADPYWCTALLVLFYGGLRLGELLGLSWQDVELGSSRLFVRRQLCGQSGVLRPPKTAAGQRFVSLPPFVIAVLREWKLACPTGPLDLVFPNADGGPMDQHNFHKRAWRPALRRAGLRHIRVHDARHSCASMWIATGADVVAVSRALGHRDPSITLKVYSHLFSRRSQSDLGEKLAALVAAETDGCSLVVAVGARKRKRTQVLDRVGGPAWIRTKDQGIMSPLH